MPLPLQPVKSGDPINGTPAATWNRFIAATRWVEAQMRTVGGGQAGAPTPNPVIVRVKNASGSDVAAGGVLGIDEPIFPPTGDELSANTLLQIDLKGITPAAKHRGAFVVTLEPLKKDAVGRAVAMGLCWVKVKAATSDEASYGFAEVNSSLTALKAASTIGSAKILYRQAGIGEKWALVRLDNGGTSGAAAKQLKTTSAGAATVSAKEWDGETLGDTVYTVVCAQGHDAGEVIYAVELDNVANTWVEIVHFDVSVEVGKVYQVGDSLGHIVPDWVRAH